MDPSYLGVCNLYNYCDGLYECCGKNELQCNADISENVFFLFCIAPGCPYRSLDYFRDFVKPDDWLKNRPVILPLLDFYLVIIFDSSIILERYGTTVVYDDFFYKLCASNLLLLASIFLYGVKMFRLAELS